jgi:ketosteroid isomerase-like protein
MGLRALLIATVVILLAVPAGADTADEGERAVRAIQAAFDQGDVETLRGLMTEDHVSTLTYAHFSNAAELLKALADYQFSEYKISALRVKPLTQDVALASHHATITGTYQGREVPSPVQVTTVWVKRGGKWLEAF